MANLQVKDAAAASKYLKSTGVGSDVDPHIPEHLETNSAAVLSAVGSIKTAVELIDNAVGGTELQVDVVAALPAGNNNIGNVDIVTLPNTVEADITAVKTAVELIDDTVSGTELQVDVVAALPAGTNLLGKVGIDQTTPGTTNKVVASIASAGVASGAIAAGAVAAGAVVSGAIVSGAIATGAIVDLPAKGQAAMAASVPVAIASNQSAVQVKGSNTSVTVTLTVTNGVYSVGDVVGGLLTFANAVSANGKTALIKSLKLTGVAAIPYELWFFNADIGTPAADNAAFALAVADGPKFLGAVPILAADYNAGQNSFNFATVRNIGLAAKAAAANTSLYAYLKATAVTSPETTTIYLTVDFEYLD